MAQNHLPGGGRRRWLAGLGAAAVVAGLGAVLVGRRARGERDLLVVADGRQMSSALFYIALINGYFAEEGLDIEVQSHSYSRRAMESLTDGKADLAMSSEVPIMHALADGHSLKVVANIQTCDRDLAILGRRDRAISGPASLAGKRIGYIPRSNGRVFLDLFMAAYGLTGSVQTLAFKPEDLVPALVTGTVDAVSSWTAIRLAAAGQMTDTVTIPAPAIYIECWGIAVAATVAEHKRRALEKLLRGLLRAERLASAEPGIAIANVADYLGQDREGVAALWPQFDFAVNLNQTFIINLENAARSERSADADPSKVDFSRAIDARALRNVDARRISLLQ